MDKYEIWRKIEAENFDDMDFNALGDYIFSQLKEEYARGKIPSIYKGNVKDYEFDFAPAIGICMEDYSNLNKLKMTKAINFFIDRLNEHYDSVSEIVPKERIGNFIFGLCFGIGQFPKQPELFDSDQTAEAKKLKNSLDFLVENHIGEESSVLISLGEFLSS